MRSQGEPQDVVGLGPHRLRRAIRIMLVGAVAIILLAASVAYAQAPPFGPIGDTPISGARVFGSKGCVKCHSVNGLGGKVGPDLARVAQPRSFFDLASSLWNHAPRMADRMRELNIARPRLDAHEAGGLVAFLYTLDYF